MPGQQARVCVLHVHFGVSVDQLTECAIIVDHIECTDVARSFRFSHYRLIFALAHWWKQPAKILYRTDKGGVLPHHVRECHGSTPHGRIGLKKFDIGRVMPGGLGFPCPRYLANHDSSLYRSSELALGSPSKALSLTNTTCR